MFGFGGGGASIEIPMRDMRNEGRQSLQAQTTLMPEVLSAEQQYRPEFARLQTNLMGGALSQYAPMFSQQLPGLENANIVANRTASTGALETAQRLAPMYRRTDEALNPELMQLFAISEAAGMAGSGQLPGTTQRLQDEFFSRIGQGLTSAEERDLSQSVRAGANDRGMYRSNKALLDEATRLTQANEERRGRNNQLASGFLNSRLSQIGGLTANRMSRAINPYQSVQQSRMGVDSGQVFGLADRATNARAQLFDPYNSYAQDVFSSNQNAAATQAAANAELEQSGNSSMLGGIGTLVGGAAGFMFGGPGGAALGANLGGSAGSAIGAGM